MSKIISGFFKIFGKKSDQDIKDVMPLVEEVHTAYATISLLSNDELRNKTTELKIRVTDYIKSDDTEIHDLRKEIEDQPNMEVEKKEKSYNRIDELEKSANAKTEEVLLQILPEAFAIVKETAKRFSENESIEVIATDFDRDLAAYDEKVTIQGDKAHYKTTWLAGGVDIRWDMTHYDVQLLGGIILHNGNIAEMATGEGKTLVATLPLYLNALAGKGVHVVTVNDYLAKRDSEWMGTLFEFHGLKVDCIDKHEPNSESRRNAYLADITYGTNNEFGFDYLRDNMASSVEGLVQRKHYFAIVDEVDSVLIDDARTPLIISGPTPRGDHHEFHELKPRVEKLIAAQRSYITTALADAKKKLAEDNTKDGGMALLRAFRGLPKNKALIKYLSEDGIKARLQKTENFYMQDQSKEMHLVDEELFFVIDEKNNSIELTEKGIDLITDSSDDQNFFILPDVGEKIANIEKSTLPEKEQIKEKEELMRDFSIKGERIHTMNQLLKAYTLFEMDVEYVVIDNKVKIVDEQTGRVMEGRRYSDGLHQAIEAKENVKIEDATQTYATITLQNYFRMYHKLSGMTGTAETEAGELWDIYKLDVVVIPTNKPIVRKDEEDLIYKTTREKYNAVIEEIDELTKAGRPVLVGTTSVEISELLSRMLKMRNIKHNVLNAKLHQREADIVAEAGQTSAVTIATNMAGRGTDIKLGPGVLESGGLSIIGTERHESRRVDRQLRGRAGRQGDPGSSQFYVSLEDNLMRLFGSGRIASLMDRMGLEEGEVIQHSMITKSIERAQKKVEENNFGIRKKLLEYDDVMNSQREVIYNKRKHALYGERLSVDIANMIYDVCEGIIEEYQEHRDFEGFKMELLRVLSVDSPVNSGDFMQNSAQEITPKVYTAALERYKSKSAYIAESAFPVIKDVYENQSATFENIVVPFTDGIKTLQVIANLEKSYTSNGVALVKAFEKNITLAIIDDAWKEHLREMDDLRQSVQQAVYEQKDPLLIYKFESFNLFKAMMQKFNVDITSFLFKGGLPVPKEGQQAVKQAEGPKRTDYSRVTADKGALPEVVQPRSPGQAGANGDPGQRPQQQVQPIRVDKKVGRNEACPCGSGKKYKQCHGR
ncbi:MAG TPA: preprotein translocase subunit SecA [Flavobacteriales bacterium]|nr:preprotein translocase subunit SecA [Flavobacteriales bacterium]